MKKLFALVMGIMFLAGGSLMAESIAFSYGINFFSPAESGFATANGRTTILQWTLDNDLTFGVVNEQTVLDHNNGVGSLAVNGIRITQSVMDRVCIGIGLGSGVTSGFVTDDQGSVVDIIGEVTLFEGSGNRVSGALVAMIAARYMNTPNLNIDGGTPVSNLNGTNAGLAVKLGF